MTDNLSQKELNLKLRLDVDAETDGGKVNCDDTYVRQYTILLDGKEKGHVVELRKHEAEKYGADKRWHVDMCGDIFTAPIIHVGQLCTHDKLPPGNIAWVVSEGGILSAGFCTSHLSFEERCGQARSMQEGVEKIVKTYLSVKERYEGK